MLSQAQAFWAYICVRYGGAPHRGEEGSVVEKVILTAIFAGLAIAVGVIIVNKVMAKAGSLDLN
jgi:hypothetical protein